MDGEGLGRESEGADGWIRRFFIILSLFFRLISELIYLSHCDHMYARYIYTFCFVSSSIHGFDDMGVWTVL